MNETKSQVGSNAPISLSDEESVKEVLVKSLFGLWDIANNLTRLTPSKRPFYRVSIFGSARATEGSSVYHEVRRLAAQLSELGCEIVTGGGPGLMQAANEGAESAPDQGQRHSIGIRVKLPFEQAINKYVNESYVHQTFFSRLHHFALASDAFVVAPGGIGTVLETLMAWQLLQVKHLPPMPLILIGKMYQELVEWAKRSMLNESLQLASPDDLIIPRCVDTVEEAVAIIAESRADWLKNSRQ